MCGLCAREHTEQESVEECEQNNRWMARYIIFLHWTVSVTGWPRGHHCSKGKPRCFQPPSRAIYVWDQGSFESMNQNCTYQRKAHVIWNHSYRDNMKSVLINQKQCFLINYSHVQPMMMGHKQILLYLRGHKPKRFGSAAMHYNNLTTWQYEDVNNMQGWRPLQHLPCFVKHI